jgi:hypothetical protein
MENYIFYDGIKEVGAKSVSFVLIGEKVKDESSDTTVKDVESPGLHIGDCFEIYHTKENFK